MTNVPSFLVEVHPASEDIQFLEDQINTFNVEKTGIRTTDDLLLAIFVREENGAIRAGVFGWTWGGCCEIRYLWVDEAWRGQGYGQGLLDAAEREARRRGCRQVILDTHSFQAPLFYQRNGYDVVGVIDNYPEGYQKYYLKKQLA
jgi:GNAT superfamily N-acetyltransferase